MKNSLFYLTVLFTFLICVKQKLNAQILSVQTGNWNATTTWSCSCVPTSADNVKIVAGHTVNLTTNQTVNNLELEGNLNLNTNSRTLTVNGNFKGSGTSTISGGSVSRSIVVNGNFDVNAGSSVSIGSLNLTVNGTTTINGTLTLSTNTGVKTFVGTIVNNGTWTSTAVTTDANLIVRNGINNFGTFNAGAIRFDTNNQSIGGNSPLSFSGTFMIAGAITVSNNNTLNLSGQLNGNTATSTFTAGTNSVVFYSSNATPMATGIINCGTNPNTFVYNRNGNQNVSTGNYYNLIIDGTGDKTLTGSGSINVTNNFTVESNANLLCGGIDTNTGGTFTLKSLFNHTEGIATQHQMGNFVLDGGLLDLGNIILDGWVITNDFTVTTNGGTINSAGDPTNGFTVGGNTKIFGNFVFTNNNSAQIAFFNGLVTVHASGSWNSTGLTSTNIIHFRANIVNNGTFNAGGCTFDINNQNLSGNLLTFYNTVTLTGVQVNNYTTVNLASTATCLTGTGQWVQQANSYLKIAGDVNTVTMFTSASNNTVEYYNNVQQDVGAGTYYHLLINKSGSRADLAGANAGTINVNGNFTIQQGEFRFNNAGDILNVMGNSLITGTTSKLEMTAGTPTANLNHLTLSNGGTIASGTTSVTGNVNATTFTVSGSGTNSIGRCNFTVSSTSSINGNLSLNDNTGVKTFVGLVTIGAMGSWNSTSITTTSNLIFQNGIQNNNSFNASAATFNTNDQALNGNPFNFSGIITVNSITLTNNSTVNHTSAANNAITGTGTWLQAPNSILNTTASSLNINALNASASNNTVNYNRNNVQTIFHPLNGEYFHLTLSNTFTKTSSPGIKIILGNLSIQGTASLNVSTNNVDLEIRGNWLNSSTAGDPFNEGTRTVIFNGTNPQIIQNTGSQLGTDFYNLVINNSSSTGVFISGNANIHTRIVSGGTLTLQNGYVYTNYSNMIVVLDGGNSSAGSINSFVNGPIRKIGNEAFVFPTGQDVTPMGKGPEDVWARIGISAPTNVSTEFTAQYFFTSYGNLTKDATLTHVSFHEYWTLDRAVTTNAVKVTLYYESATRSHITDYTSSDLVVARYTSGNFWTSEGQTARSNTNPGWITSNVVSNFSPFTFGSITGGNPFPVEITHFSALQDGNKIKLSWTTASEINTDYFQIEKSIDGINFSILQTQDAAGYSNSPISYQDYDFNPTQGISYYRLKTVDNDGKFVYSNVVAVYYQNQAQLSIYPNPFNNLLNIQLPHPQENLEITVTDLTGKLIFKQHYTQISKIEFNTNNWTPGLYILRLKNENLDLTEKIIKE